MENQSNDTVMRDRYLNYFIYYLQILILVFLLKSCATPKNQMLPDRIYLSTLNIPEAYDRFVIIPIGNSKIFVVNVTLLLQTYEKCYKSSYPNETDFLVALYSNKIYDIKEKFEQCTGYDISSKVTNIDKQIMNMYKKHGIEYIKSNYLKNIDFQFFEFKQYPNDTVLYILFMNNYYLHPNAEKLIISKEQLFILPPP